MCSLQFRFICGTMCRWVKKTKCVAGMDVIARA